MKHFVLDTSALLTLRDNEPGADRVAEVLHAATAGNSISIS
jgi:PIN domain nuclease of toxin-antitoxin system